MTFGIQSLRPYVTDKEEEDVMKKLIARALVAALVLSVASFGFASQHTEAGSWTGVVTDTACGAKGAKASHADCAVKCVKEKGAKFALYSAADKQVYVLSNQEEAEKMAGKEVTVKGKVDKEKKMIEVESMEPATK
jgi:hypothetical protein